MDCSVISLGNRWGYIGSRKARGRQKRPVGQRAIGSEDKFDVDGLLPECLPNSYEVTILTEPAGG